ncbi:hypothetical protein NKG94_23265 [Micromonospora sp. M12]
MLRADVLRALRVAPLTAGLLRLAWTAAAVLLALGLLGLALAAAAGASQRWQTLTRLRTLGLRPRDARWVAAGSCCHRSWSPRCAARYSGPCSHASRSARSTCACSPAKPPTRWRSCRGGCWAWSAWRCWRRPPPSCPSSRRCDDATG